MPNCEHDSTRCEPIAMPFQGCVDPHNCAPAAHGCVRYIDRCQYCGSQRERLVNGAHIERGPWEASATPHTHAHPF